MNTTQPPENPKPGSPLGLGLREGLGPLAASAWAVNGNALGGSDGGPALWKRAPDAEELRMWADLGVAATVAPLYTLTPEDVAAVNATRKERAFKALRRLDLCRCDHTEYCHHCHPVEFRAGGVWGGPNVRAKRAP
jgi:hypothetical protein